MPPPSSGYLTDSAPVKETHLPPPSAGPSSHGTKAVYKSRAGDRGKSPAEFMQERARALSPVDYDEEEGDRSLHSYLLAEPRGGRKGAGGRAGSAALSLSGAGAGYQSFSLDTSAQLHSGSFSELDAEVERAKAAAAGTPAGSTSKRRNRTSQAAPAAAYVPAEGDNAASEDTDGEGGEGLAAHMDRRANRGVMPERGPGYLGMGEAFRSGSSSTTHGRKQREIVRGREHSVEVLSESEESPKRWARGTRGTSMRGRRSGTAASQKARDKYAEEQTPFTPPANRQRAGGTMTPALQRELTYEREAEPYQPDAGAGPTTAPTRPPGLDPLAFAASFAHSLSTGISAVFDFLFGWLIDLWPLPDGRRTFLKICAAVPIAALAMNQLTVMRGEPALDRMESQRTKPVSRGWSSTARPGTAEGGASTTTEVDWPDEPESWRSSIQDSLAGLHCRVDGADGKQSAIQEQQNRWTATLRQTEQDLRAQLAKEVALAREASVTSERQLVELSAQLDAITEELGRVRGLPREFADFRAASEAQGERVQHRLAGVESKLERVERDLAAGITEERFLGLLERALPSRVPVTQQGSKISLAPAFLAELQRLLAPATSATDKTRASWDDFILDNEAALRQWTISVFESEARSKGLVDKHEFTEVLKREIAAARPAQTNVKDTSGKDVTATLTSMIDAALLRYSKDVIARADHALATAGGDIIPHFTSPTLMLERPRLWRSVFLGTRAKRGRDPTIVLWGETTPGVCWPFAGAEGQVGIKLGGRVKVTDVTIDHVPRELVPVESMQGAAPRDVEVVSAEEMRDGGES